MGLVEGPQNVSRRSFKITITHITFVLPYVNSKLNNTIEVFVDIVLVFEIHFVSKNSIGVERLAMFAIWCRIKKSIYKSCAGGTTF